MLDGREALTRYGYAGYERDTATGYYKTAARWYDPATGKWLSEDPSGLGPDVNMYRYVGNGVTNWVDPGGRDKKNPYPQGTEDWFRWRDEHGGGSLRAVGLGSMRRRDFAGDIMPSLEAGASIAADLGTLGTVSA